MGDNKSTYTEDSIKSLDWKQHIRLRPGMYIGKLGDGSSKDDGIYVTVPPYPITGDDFTDSYANQILREDCDTDRIVKAIKKFTKSYKIKVDLDRAIYGDNIKIKLKVND